MIQGARILRLLRMTLLLAAFAGAAARAAEPAPPIDLMPSLGVRNGIDLQASVPAVPPAEAGASASLGLGVEVFVRPDGWFEAYVDHQNLRFTADPAFGTTRFDLAVDYLQFGGGYEPQIGRVRPFVAAALGITRYGASNGTVKNTIGASGSLGGGFRVPVSDRVSFRFEVRGYATASSAAVSVACGAGCFVEFAASGWYQLAARAGIAVRL
jgi:hypothetical protein